MSNVYARLLGYLTGFAAANILPFAASRIAFARPRTGVLWIQIDLTRE
jgi:hypothetical protein